MVSMPQSRNYQGPMDANRRYKIDADYSAIRLQALGPDLQGNGKSNGHPMPPSLPAIQQKRRENVRTKGEASFNRLRDAIPSRGKTAKLNCDETSPISEFIQR
jgi:hypothetical protein